MKFLFLPAVALLAGAASTVHAQTTVSLGLRLGGNLATRTGSDPTLPLLTSNGTPAPNTVQDYKRGALLAPQFGAVLDVRFGKLAVQPAVLFSQKVVDQRLNLSSSNSSGNYTSTSSDQYHTVSRPSYLEIPINLVYTSGTDHGFQLFAGPYPGPPLSFFPYPNNNTSPTPFAASSGYNTARRFDAGLNAGVGYRRGPLQVQLGYGLGLINQQPNKAADQRDDLPAYYQRVAQLTATYFMKAN